MKHKITKLIQDHLEYLGYSVEDKTTDDSSVDELFAKHDHRADISLFCDDSGVIVIKVNFGYYALSNLDAVMREANLANFSAIVTKWRVEYGNNDLGLLLSVIACQFGYDKQHFSTFVTFFEEEVSTNVKNFQQYSAIKDAPAIAWVQ